jgi:hypothetical protein
MLPGMRNILPITLTLLLAAVTAFAQGATAVAILNTPVYIAPDASRTPLRTAAQGTVFTVVAEEGEWTKVQFKDPQWGVRVGYVQTKALRFSRPELAPMDLSTTPTNPVETVQAAPPVAAPVKPRPWEVPEPASSFERGFIDVNFGVAWANEGSFTFEVNDTVFRETRTFRTTYENPTGASFDFGGGFMFTPEIGVGVSFAGTAHQSPTELHIRVPHPFAADAHATDTEETEDALQRVEGSVNIQLVGAATIGERTRVRVFAGPTYFRVQQDLVSDIRYTQAFGVFTRANQVEITTYDVEEKVESTGWGYHVGGDISFFFNRVIGIGAFVRFSRGTVDIEEPITGDELELRTGGVQTGGGLRLKF